MKIAFYIYAIRDSHGNEWGTVTEESGNTVSVHGGLKTADGEPVYFESEAYHLRRWAVENGFTYWEEARSLEIKF